MAYLNIGFIASHRGSNMQAVIDATKEGELNVKPAVVISNNSNSLVLERAKSEGIPCYHISQIKYPTLGKLDDQIFSVLQKHEVDIILLLGYMKKLGPKVLKGYKGKVLNIHPSLLPKYGGKGMYGKFVHEAVLQAGEKETGVTVHLVDEEYDTGAIISQCRVPIYENDDVFSLTNRVKASEHELIVKTLKNMEAGNKNAN